MLINEFYVFVYIYTKLFGGRGWQFRKNYDSRKIQLNYKLTSFVRALIYYNYINEILFKLSKFWSIILP